MADPAKNDRLTALAFAAQSGDKSALVDFIRLSQGDVWRLCSYLGGSSRADDLAQETFERALRSLPRFRGESGARPWLLSICRRVIVDDTRRSIRRRRIDDAAKTSAAIRPTSAGLDSTIELDLAVEALGHDRRIAFVLTQVIGLPYAEVAVVLDVPIGTVRSRVARARMDLMRLLADDEHVERAIESTSDFPASGAL